MKTLIKLTWFTLLSRQVGLFTLLAAGFLGTTARSHEVRPAIADVSLTHSRLELVIRLSAEGILAGIDLSGVGDTNEAPEAPKYNALRLMSSEELEARWRAAWPELRKGFIARASVPLDLQLDSVVVPPIGDIDLPRDTGISISAVLPKDASPVVLGWTSEYGPLVIRQGDGETGYSGYLLAGDLSQPLPREGVAYESLYEAVIAHVTIGFVHIVPKGLDHILFVLGLFFFSLHLRPLFIQVTAFTLAHTAALALASLGYVSVPANIVEPLIAASIVYVAVENIFHNAITWSRTLIVFGFGLLHGLGFASVLSQIGVEQGRFVVDLISFNIGVEIGQITVILAAFLAVGLWFGHKEWYRRRIAVPASAVIALIGLYWVVDRTVL